MRTQTVGRRRGGRAGAGRSYRVDGVEDGGEEVGVGEVRNDELAVRQRRWLARVAVPLRPPPALAVDGARGSGRRGRGGGAGVLPVGLALPWIGRVSVGGVCCGGEPRVSSPGTPPVLYSTGDGDPPARRARRPRLGCVKGVRLGLWV